MGHTNLNKFIYRIVASYPAYKAAELEKMPLHEILDLHEHIDIQNEREQFARTELEKKWAQSEN